MAITTKTLRICRWTCISLAVFAFAFLLFPGAIPLRWKNPEVRSNAHDFLVVIIPLLVLLSRYFGYLYRFDRPSPVPTVVYSVVLSITVFFLAVIFNFFATTWVDEQLLYESKTADKQIIQQTGSWDFNTRCIEVMPFILGLQKVVPVDITTLEKSGWKKISHEEGYITW